jgi:hypothetical protein
MANSISWGKSVENLLTTANPQSRIETENNYFLLLENSDYLVNEIDNSSYNGYGKIYDITNWGDPITI